MIIKDFIDELALSGAINGSDICGALKVINAGRRLLYPLDDWTGTIDYGCVNLCESCFYLPYHIETVRSAWQCAGEIPLGDEIWSSISAGYLSSCCGDPIGITRTDRSVAIPTQPPVGSIIGVRPLDSTDKGFKIRFTIRNVMGSLDYDEIEVNSYDEIKYGELLMGKIESIQKDSTFGQIAIYYRDNKGVNCRLHTLQPDEVSPRYYMYKATCQSGYAIVKAKKKYFPYTERDIYSELDIQSSSGLMFAIKALEHQRSSQYDKYTAALKIARSHLERQKEDLKKTSSPAKVPASQTYHPVSNLRYG